MNGYKVRNIELKRFYVPGQIYFITTITENRRKIFIDEENIGILLETFQMYREKYRFKLIAYVILPDHFHFMIIPSKEINISKIMKGIKGSSARNINRSKGRKNSIWQHQFLDHIIRKGDDYKKHIEYIHNNPIKHQLADSNSIQKYKWSSYRNYFLDDDSVFKVDTVPL
jgi:putative transposase